MKATAGKLGVGLRLVTIRRTTTQVTVFETVGSDDHALTRAGAMFDSGAVGVSEHDEVLHSEAVPEAYYPGIDDETGRFSLPEDL